MSNSDDGGPAFPMPAHEDKMWEEGDDDRYVKSESGMSLRDYFAAHAPKEIPHGFQLGIRPSQPPPNTPKEKWDAYEIAEADWSIRRSIAWSWHYADEMLKARKT
jgi:hypothetical protein